jgi:hypothetical protein
VRRWSSPAGDAPASWAVVHSRRGTRLPARAGAASLARVDELGRILRDQEGIVARRQALAGGMTRAMVEWKLSRGDWLAVHPGVYAAHTGPLTGRQRAWAAVLLHWPAALSHESAIDRPSPRIHVAVELGRHLVERPGIALHRVSGFEDRVFWNLTPPRVQYEHAVLDVAEGAAELDAIAVLAEACSSRRTWAARLEQVLASRGRCRRRAWFAALLDDIDQGTCSVLEQRWLEEERRHGLPRGRRQKPAGTSQRRMFRDVEYEEQAFVLELDGRLGHETAADRDRDLERDLDAAIDRLETVRLGYGQVVGRGCVTAAKVGRILQRKGWTGAPVRCPQCPRDMKQGGRSGR